MTVYRLDPLTDARWDAFLQDHPQASVFHTSGWLNALSRTYGFVPIVITTSSPDSDLRNGLACCSTSSWLSGRRLVSLPFSDHCAPLLDNAQTLHTFMDYLRQCVIHKEWASVEVRLPDSSVPENSSSFETDKTFVFHKLTLGVSLDELFAGFHKDCIQRKLSRASREELAYEDGVSESLLNKFYDLVLLTRRRQGLPPQPVAWFRNLIACLGDKVKIRLASKNSNPIAGILTLQYKKSLVYKYGCSDQTFSNLGGTQFLFWKAIQEAKSTGLDEFDMGRSDWANAGLVVFKDRWGATRSTLAHLRYPNRSHKIGWAARKIDIAKHVVPYIPDGWLAAAGRVLYKHMA